MPPRYRMVNVDETNISDLILVCSSKMLADRTHQQGIALKIDWLKEMTDRFGTCGKIAYLDDEPVAEVLFYPEEADPTRTQPRKGVLILKCVYNPNPKSQKLGLGSRIVQSVISDAKSQKSCFGNVEKCRFILAKAFDTKEGLSLPTFYTKMGFKPTDQEDDLMWYSVTGEYEPTYQLGEYKPLSEDKNRAVMFYDPTCQFSYAFATKVEEIIAEISPHIKIDLINSWKKPAESIKRGNRWLIVNAKPIHTFFTDTERFKKEIAEAATRAN